MTTVGQSKRMRAGLLSLCLLAGVPAAESMNTEDLCAEFMRQLQELNPAGTVEKHHDLEVKLTDDKGREMLYYLDNCRKLVAANPANATEIIAKYIQAYNQGPAEVPEGILPLVKDAAWIDEMMAKRRSTGVTDVPGFAFEALNDQLVVVYALESVRGISYLTPEKLQQILPDASGVRALAVENLERTLSNVELSGSDGFFMFTAGGTYEASLLLLDNLWTTQRIKVKGDFVVGIPSRDIVVITGSGEKEGLKRVREYVDRAIARNLSSQISADLFVRRDGRWEKWSE